MVTFLHPRTTNTASTSQAKLPFKRIRHVTRHLLPQHAIIPRFASTMSHDSLEPFMPWIRNAASALTLFAIGCAGSEPSRTPASEPTSIPSESAASAPPAEARTLFGSIARLTEGELSFDEAELLVGTAADEAARAAGELEAGEHVDNDYHIRDNDHELVTFPIAADAEVHLLKRSGPPDHTSETVTSKSSLALLARYFQASDPDSKSVRAARYRLTVRAGTVTRLEEVFFP
jgi:hypothetical protein